MGVVPLLVAGEPARFSLYGPLLILRIRRTTPFEIDRRPARIGVVLKGAKYDGSPGDGLAADDLLAFHRVVPLSRTGRFVALREFAGVLFPEPFAVGSRQAEVSTVGILLVEL
ncbi:hypothetical protein [Halomicrobium katesii]|uniref:hypothetical protein n=1 Tax=Halomicrobium katesii TaxID=437163 RepID=UPI0012BAEB2D|nr:hypothetical protein [Halomicrobium katesii]